MEPGAFLPERDPDKGEQQERWRRLQKCAFSLRTTILGLLLDQITLLVEDLQEAEVRVHRQKEGFSKGQDRSASLPVSQVSGVGGVSAGGQRKPSATTGAAASAVGEAAAEGDGRSCREALQEKPQRLQRKIFEMLEEIHEAAGTWRPTKQLQDGAAAGCSGDDVPAPLDHAAAVSRCLPGWLENPKSSLVYKKARMLDTKEVLPFSQRLTDWMVETASFADELLGAVTKLCFHTERLDAALGSCRLSLDDYLNLQGGEEDGAEQGNEGAAVESELVIGETKSEGGQEEGSVMEQIEAALGSLKVKVDDDLKLQDEKDGPPGNGKGAGGRGKALGKEI